MTLTVSEEKYFKNLEKKKKKNKLRGSELSEYERLLAKRNEGDSSSGLVTKVQETKAVPISKNTKYTISVDSVEKRDAIQAALDDIEAYRNSEMEKIQKEVQSIEAEARKRVNETANEQTAAACKEIIDAANKEAERIRKEAKDKSEEDAREYLLKAKSEAEAAEEEHKNYVTMRAEITAQKIDYRHEALKDVEKEMITITEEREAILKELSELNETCTKLKHKNTEMEGDLRFYEESFGKVNEARHKLLSLEAENQFMTEEFKIQRDLCKEKSEEIIRLKDKLLALGEDPEETRAKLEYLHAQVEELSAKLEKYPSNWEEIVQRSSEFDLLRDKLEEVNNEKIELKNKIFGLQLEQNELEDYRKFVKILELQRDELRAELDRNISQYENRNGKVFAGLSKIDGEVFTKHPHKTVDLKTLCQNFRSYLNCRGSDKTSNKGSLYYDERTIRTFIAGFASSRTMIFEGLSGTGKTSLPMAFADFMGSTTDVVAVQSSWKDKNDILGFYNDFKKQYTETDFLKYLYRASCDHENIHLIVLDEMNLSRIEYYFADILSKLELVEGKRTISLMPNAHSIGGPDGTWPKRIHDGELEIPDNVWFIGTANKDDSTFTITDKVYDRSVVISFDSKGVPDKSLKYVGPDAISFEDFKKALNETRWSESSKDRQTFQNVIEYLDELLEPFSITFGNRIYRQLERFVPAYMACGGSMKEAIDVMFSLKVIRKLEGLYDDRTKTNLEELESKLESMPLSQARVRMLSSRIA